MPASINSANSQSFDKIWPKPTNVVKRKLKKTKEMVEDALTELHSRKGVTLKQVYKFISTNYDLESLSNARESLIKKHITTLRESGDIVNKTGKGLTGHFKLIDKNRFIQNIKKNKDDPNAIRKAKASKKRDIKKLKIDIKHPALTIRRQITPIPRRNNNLSIFDTPMTSTRVHASTPSLGFIPRAPEVKKRANRKTSAQDNLGTPRSSLPKEKRKLFPRSERV